MVKADIIYKIKQSNGTVTNYEEKTIETDTYDGFLQLVEDEMRDLENKLGRKIRLEVKKLKRKKEIEKSKDLKAKEAISIIKESSIEKINNFISNNEDRVTVLNAYDLKIKSNDN